MSDPKKLYRKKQKIIRVTEAENELILKRMSHFHFKNFNTYARHMLLTGRVVTIDYSELVQLKTEINRIGTNVNQLARYVNTNEVISLENYQELHQAMVEIKELMEAQFNRETAIIEKYLKESQG